MHRRSRFSGLSLAPKGRAFTLIELLVVIAIIALLVSIIVPALGKARKLAAATKELVEGRSLETAEEIYATEQKGEIIPASPSWNNVHPTTTHSFVIRPVDFYKSMVDRPYMEGSAVKTWTWLLYTSSGEPPSSMQQFRKTFEDFNSRSKTGFAGTGPGWVQHGSDTAQAALSYHPSFGMNGVFVGGSYPHGAFDANGGGAISGPSPFGRANRSQVGQFNIRRKSSITRPSDLIIFATSRGADVRGGGFWSYGQAVPNPTASNPTVHPGYFLITPPRNFPASRGATTANSGVAPAVLGASPTGNSHAWFAGNTWDPRQAPSYWGNVRFSAGDPNGFGFAPQAAVACADGHGELMDIAKMRDMRRWSNYADSATWDFRKGP